MSLYNITESEVDITRAAAAVDEVDIMDEVDTVEKHIGTDGWHIFGTECPKEEIVFLVSDRQLVHGHRAQHLQLDCRARRLDPLDGFVEQLVGLSTTQSIAEKITRWRPTISISFYPATHR